VSVRKYVSLAAVLVVLIAIAVSMQTSGQGSSVPSIPTPSCGWDLTTAAGVQANADYQTATMQWLETHGADDGPPPKPESPYWLGECPVSPESPLPPVDEALAIH
jgi:hypothetical protein